jgi:uncharacterized sodium:solute symporter family permease YidK
MLAAKDLTTARRGALFGRLLKVTPVLICLVPGLIVLLVGGLYLYFTFWLR